MGKVNFGGILGDACSSLMCRRRRWAITSSCMSASALSRLDEERHKVFEYLKRMEELGELG